MDSDAICLTFKQDHSKGMKIHFRASSIIFQVCYNFGHVMYSYSYDPNVPSFNQIILFFIRASELRNRS